MELTSIKRRSAADEVHDQLLKQLVEPTIVAFQRWRLAPEWRAAAVGALVGLVAWFAPGVVGSGENLVATLLADAGTLPLAGLLGLQRLVAEHGVQRPQPAP